MGYFMVPVFLLVTLVYAESAIQTDWSGGGGVWGPVADWSNVFHSSEDAVCVNPGWIELGLETLITEHTLESDISAAYSVYAEDVDGDGDMDVLRAANGIDDVTWWENVNGIGTSWIEHVVDCSFSGAISIYAEDVDGDGDTDILVAEYIDDYITWCENVDGTGTSWVQHEVDGCFGAISVYAQDVDGDGDIDVLGAAYENGNISWCENVNGIGTSWIEHTVDSTFYEARSVFAEDVDGDGDMDVLGAAYWANDITWWENANGIGTNWIEHTVDGMFRASSVHAEDLDGDGDTDLLGAGQYSWGCITWWENADWIGTDWIEHTVDGDLNNAQSVYAADIDGDGNVDVLGADYAFPGSITWWDLWGGYCPAGHLESSILNVQCDPDWGWLDWSTYEPGGTDVSFQVRASAAPDSIAASPWSEMQYGPCSLEGLLEDSLPYVQYRVTLLTSDPDTTPALHDLTLSWTPTGIGGEEPSGTHLLPVRPNPVRGAPVLRFGLEAPGPVSLRVYDLSGRIVWERPAEMAASGEHAISLGVPLAPGTYFCRMEAGAFLAVERFLVLD